MKQPKRKRYGRLRFLEIAGSRSGRALWRVRCDCGRFKIVLADNVRGGRTRSCGCGMREAARKRSTSHGMSKTVTYARWASMIQRCKKNLDYVGRVSVCRRWLSFTHFLSDMGECPAGLTLERIHNDKDYRPGNCKWATSAEQNRNTRHNVILTFRGKTQCAADWAKEIGIAASTLRQRLYRGWPIEEVLTAPFSRQTTSLEAFGRTQSISEWAAEFGIHMPTLRDRLFRDGLPLEVALTKKRYARVAHRELLATLV